MFALGNVFIGQYKIWVTNPVFTVHPWDSGAESLAYYSVMVSRFLSENTDKTKNYLYIDLALDPIFKDILSLDQNKRATEKTDPVEFASYMESKNQTMPILKLSRDHVIKVLELVSDEEQIYKNAIPSPNGTSP